MRMVDSKRTSRTTLPVDRAGGVLMAALLTAIFWYVTGPQRLTYAEMDNLSIARRKNRVEIGQIGAKLEDTRARRGQLMSPKKTEPTSGLDGFVMMLIQLAESGDAAEFDPQDMRTMGGLKKFMPSTRATFLIATLAIAGIPLLSGFFSKDEILFRAFESASTNS